MASDNGNGADTKVLGNAVRRPPNAGKGRQKGVPNKFTTEARLALEQAFKGLGGIEGLTAWATEHPSEFYKLWAKLVPIQTELSGNDGGPIELRVRFIRDPRAA